MSSDATWDAYVARYGAKVYDPEANAKALAEKAEAERRRDLMRRIYPPQDKPHGRYF